MTARSYHEFLPAVRRYVLERAVLGCTVITLSNVVRAVDTPLVRGALLTNKSKGRLYYWRHGSQQKKPSTMGHRGWIHRCLSQLSKEQLVLERQRPETIWYREGIDKMFKIRVSRDVAIATLTNLGFPIPLPEPEHSVYLTKTLMAKHHV